jgi:hypothetical protein
MPSDLERLQKRLAHLPMQRQGFAVCLVGEAGMGKTHALQTLRRALPYPSHTLHANQNLAALLHLLPRPKRLALWLQKNLERQDSSLPTVLGLLEALAPCAVLLEDLHENSSPVWLELAQAIAQCPKIALICTSRQPVALESIALTPLEPQGSQALLERELGAVLPESAAAWIYQKAQGHPLFTLEYLRFLARLGALWNDGARWHWREPNSPAMPTEVEVLLEERLLEANLEGLGQNLVWAVAYLEIKLNIVHDDLLLAICGLDNSQLEAQQQQLRHLGIWGTGRFVHPLLRQVAFGQGRNYHARFAKAGLEALRDQPELAVRLLEDADLATAQQAALWRSSAEKLQHQPSLAAQYRLNAAALLDGQEKVSLLLEVVKDIGLGEPQKAIEIAQSILAVPNLEPEGFCTAIYALCHGLSTTTRNLAVVEAELQRLHDTERQSARFVLHLLGYKMLCGQAAAALELWEQHPEVHTNADFVVQTHLLSAWLMTGQFERVQTYSQHLLDSEISERQRMNVLNIRAIAFAQTGQLEAAEATQQLAIVVAKQTNQPNAVGTLLFNRALTLERRGERQAMRQHAEEATTALTQAGNLAMASQAQVLLANQDLEAGEYSLAQNRLETSHASLKFGTVSPYLVGLELTLAHFHRERRLPYSRTLAQKFARDALTHATLLEQPKLQAAAQSQIVLAAPKPDLEMAQNALAVLRDLPEASSVYAHAAVATALEFAQPEAAANAWTRSANRADALGFGFDAQLLRLEVARCQHNQQQAATLHDWFLERGLLHGVNVAKVHFPDLETAQAASATPTSAQPTLTVLDTMRVGNEPVKGRKRQELLLHLLEARILGQPETTTLALLDKLYPNQAETEAQIALRQLVFKTRAAHGVNTILTTPNGYKLGEPTSDLERFLHTPHLGLWRVAFPLFGSLEVRDTLHQTAIQCAQSRHESAATEVVSAMRLLLESDPYDVAAIGLACRALHHLGNPSALKRFYSTQKAKLLEVGEVLPEDWSDLVGA